MNKAEIEKAVDRRKGNKIIAKYGISYLDDSLFGITNEDFVLIGADSGVGKTELALKIAISAGKTQKVHLFALEAEDGEMNQREDYKIRAREYFKDDRKEVQPMSFPNFMLNKSSLEKYRETSVLEQEESFKNVTVINKGQNFGISELTRTVGEIKDNCDVLIIDHIDYFDLDGGDNENDHMTKLMKTLRTINQLYGIVIIAISHLRKKSKNGTDIPVMEDFIGSSNKYKQVKTVIMFAPDYEHSTPSLGLYGTFVYSPKSRLGGANRLVSRMLFDKTRNEYKDEYELFKLKGSGYLGEKVAAEEFPSWSRHTKKKINAVSYTDSEIKGY